jgi:hypothetical protein
MNPTKYRQLLNDELSPEIFVHRGLSMLEADFRETALLSLVDWVQLEIPSTLLFSSLVGLQRPSWGHWNGLILGLRAARKELLQGGGPEVREKVERATVLNKVLTLFEQKAGPTLAEALGPLGEIIRIGIGRSMNMSTVLTMPITLRNRLAHDAPAELEGWSKIARAFKPLIEFYAFNHPLFEIVRDVLHPSPWFLTEGNVVRAFNGFEQDLTVRYAALGHETKYVPETHRDILLTFQRLMGKREGQENDFRKLLAKLAPEEIKGVLMGDYLVGRPVGVGGFATVHVGRQLSTGRKVAIKILHDGLPEDARLRFKREAAYLSRLNHQNIVAIIEQGEETWTAPRDFSLSDEDWFQKFSRSHHIKSYISMEWLEGENLEELFNNGVDYMPPL